MEMKRSEIDAKYKWDLSKIYATDDDFNDDYALAEKMAKDYRRHEKTMLGSAAALLEALSDSVKVQDKIHKLWSYAFLGFAIDTTDNAAQARVSRVRTLAVAADEASWFVSPYLMRLDSETVESWYNECPELRSYSRIIDKNLARKPYTLSDECEKLLATMGDCLESHEDIRSIFANSDLQFGKIKDENGKTIQLTDVSYISKLMSSDRRVRQSAFQTLYKTYEQFSNTFATMYSSYVKEKCTLSKIRGYKSSIAASTFYDEVTPVIYNSLIKAVHKAMPTIHDYYDLKREVLGVKRLHMYDMYAPLVDELDSVYTYEQALDEVLRTAEVFGDEYYSTLKAGLCERGWVDVYPSKGKRGGAFSAGCNDTEPYILLNYDGTFNDVSTLAHEAGHSMHSYFSRKYNEPHHTHYKIFVAEVASTVNELLLAHRKLAECKSDKEKLYILNQIMETYKGTLYRQTMFAEFERNMHALCEKGQPLTADVLNKEYKKLINRYFGGRVVKDKQIAYEWMRIPHFYSAFYVYKYSTCISAASAIVKRIEEEGDAYVGQYIEFLKCGDRLSPLDSLKVAGIDMTDTSVILGAIEDFSSAISQFREIYNRTKA